MAQETATVEVKMASGETRVVTLRFTPYFTPCCGLPNGYDIDASWESQSVLFTAKGKANFKNGEVGVLPSPLPSPTESLWK